MDQYYLFLTCNSGFITEGYQKTTLRTMTPAEAAALNLRYDEHSVPCFYAKTKGEVTCKVIPAALLSPRLPKMNHLGVIVRNPGWTRFTDPGLKKQWFRDLNGYETVGKVFKFLRKEVESRNRSSTGRKVASLRVVEEFAGIPEDKVSRVPVECFCGIDLAMR